MTEKPYEFSVGAAAYSDGSGYAARAIVEPGDDGKPSVQIDVTYRLTEDGWNELVSAVNTAFEAAHKRGHR